MSIGLFIIIAIGVIYILDGAFKGVNASMPKVSKKNKQPQMKTVTFQGGPLDGVSQLVPERHDFYVAPYMPEDEDELGEPVGFYQNQMFFEPKLAYYKQITEDVYFYVRDITRKEMEKSSMTGTPPPVEVHD